MLPVGTRVVTRVEVKTDAARALRPVGAVAEIVAVPADALHSYRVRFPDGAEASVRRRELSIWSQHREDVVLLTGIHLMRTGEIEANVVRLNEDARLPQIPELVARKLAGPEAATLDDADVAFHQREIARLRRALEDAGATSALAEEPTARGALHDLLVRIRLGSIG